MIQRPLGKTGINVSEIAFGGVEIGMPYGIGVNSKEDMLPLNDAIRLLQEAVDSGINFFDTARMYGESERIMGEAFHERRHEIVIATKCRHFLDKDGNIPPACELVTIIKSSLHESLNTLKSDYVDVFMLHQANTAILNHEEITLTFENLKKEGKIRAAGASTYTYEETELAIDKGCWDVIQLPFNLMDQRQKCLFPKAYEKGVGMVIRSVLLKGLLSNRGKNLHPALAGVEKHIVGYDSLLANESYPLSTLAIKFVLSFPEVAAALVGIDGFKYLHQSIEAANGQYLEGRHLEAAERLAYPNPSFIDLPCWSKMNWLK
jgi:aryl-alcohol dehydrogenase-like predicted oxidoreductase